MNDDSTAPADAGQASDPTVTVAPVADQQAPAPVAPSPSPVDAFRAAMAALEDAHTALGVARSSELEAGHAEEGAAAALAAAKVDHAQKSKAASDALAIAEQARQELDAAAEALIQS